MEESPALGGAFFRDTTDGGSPYGNGAALRKRE
jgi:hypothetical protein